MKKTIHISIKKILVAVDGSVHSNKGVELAVDLAKLWKAKVYMIHVWEKQSIPKEFKIYSEYQRIPESLYYDFVDNQLFKPAEDKLKEAGLDIDPITLLGDPADEILLSAKKHEANIIILGYKGFGKEGRFLLGSVTDKVVRHAGVSVLVVR